MIGLAKSMAIAVDTIDRNLEGVHIFGETLTART